MAIRIVLRILVGVIFCLSAVAKLVAIDDFELYVYSFGWLPLNVSYVAARLCIGWEIVLGVLLMAGWWKKTVRLATLLTLVAFSLLLCYLALVGRNESCECMGKLVEMSPTVSLLKNAVLIMLVLLGLREKGEMRDEKGEMRKEKDVLKGERWKVVVVFVVGLVLLALPFVVSVPDSWGFGPNREPYGETALKEATEGDGALLRMGVGEGRKLVVFVTPKCPYCKLARKKIDGMKHRHDLKEGSVVYVEPTDIGEEVWLGITYGSRPMLLLIENQEVKATYHLRNVDEDEIVDFLKGER